MSNKRGEARGRCLSGTAEAAGGPVQGAVMAGGVGGQQGGGGSPASLRPEEGALALALGLWWLGALREERGKRGQGGYGWWVLSWLLLHQGLGLGVAVCRWTSDALLLSPPGVVVGGVADVVVNKGVGLLPTLIHFVFAVAALSVNSSKSLWQKMRTVSRTRATTLTTEYNDSYIFMVSNQG